MTGKRASERRHEFSRPFPSADPFLPTASHPTMDQLATLFADIRGSRDVKDSRPRDEEPFPVQEAEPARAGDAKDVREDRRSRARGNSRSTRDHSRSTLRDLSRGTSNRESRDYRDYGAPRDTPPPSREGRDSKDDKDARDSNKDAKPWKDLEPSPPPYQEIADASVPRPTHDSIKNNAQEEEDDGLPPPHPSGISPTERCVKDALSVPVDWVIHPSAPHFVICGRCYVDRIYETHQWRREFVKYRPSTGLSLRCHLGAIPHMALRWSKVHTADEFLSFLKVMQRKKVSRPCPGHVFPCNPSSVTWYTTSSIPGLRVCQECRQGLFGGTVFSKHFFSIGSSDPASLVPSICHGSFSHTKRMVEILLREDDWDHFVERVRVRIRIPGCSGRRELGTTEHGTQRWYRYSPKSSSSSASKDRHICEACYFDYVYKTNLENDWPFADGHSLYRPQCLASLRENIIPDTADVEYSRAEIMRLLHGMDRRCYAQGTVGVKWYTTPSSPWGYGICEGCYQAKIKPKFGSDTTHYFKSKKDIGRRASFSCWMNSYHPFFAQHQLLLNEALVLGDISRLETACAKLSRLPGCQQGGMGQGKNRRWWGWRSLHICAACFKGGSLADTPAGKRFELHGEKDPYHRFCDLYSTQLRDRFHHDDVGELLDFARRRQEMMV